MICQEFQAGLVDRARGIEPVSTDAARALRAHLDACPACTARFAREQQLTAGLKALAATTPSSPHASALEARLLEAFAADRASRRQTARVAVRWRPVAAAAALAFAVAGTWSAARWWPAADPVSATHPASANVVAASLRATAAPTMDARPPGAVQGQIGIKPHDAASSRRTRVGSSAGPAPSLEWAEFIPLPSAAALPEFESGRIVRVELSILSLPALGLEMMPDATRSPIEADVLVGQDGQPRAIRLVGTDTESRS